MGVFKKYKQKTNKRLFGQPCGRHSMSHKMKAKAYALKQHEKILVFKKEDRRAYQPYQLVRKASCVSGSVCTKFVVRRIPIVQDKQRKLLSLGSTSLKFKLMKNNKDITGYRIINLDLLKNHVTTITTHSCLCPSAILFAKNGQPSVTLQSEKCQNGLFSVLVAVCAGCKKQFPLETSPKQANGTHDINIRAVWGTMASGGGATDLNEQLSTMNVPQMQGGMFSSLENKIGQWWGEALKDELAKAGAEERRLAIEKGSFHEGVPAITVICDGGWSKRTHKHSYNAFGGVGVIFGAETQKLLHIGVRNKYCLICAKARNLNTNPKPHECYKNWEESSQAMESDVILSGFLEAESTHGLRYTQIIADGDSSVFSNLQENVPVWGRSITKLECANHTCKCLRANLEKLVLEKPQYKGRGKLTKLNRVRLTTAIRCAIRMRTKDRNVKQLRKDIINSIYHILGFHECYSDFCKNRKTKQINVNEENEDDSVEESFDDIFENQYEYWKLPSEKEMDNSRLASKNILTKEELKEMIKDVQVYLNRLADKCDRLIGNFTTNLCESWMSIRAKFDGGKVINRCGKGSWHSRCYGGALRKNLGVSWSPITFQNVTSEKPGEHFLKGVRRQCQLSKASSKSKAKPSSKTNRRKRKLNDFKVNGSKKAKIHYGSNLDDTADINPVKLEEMCTKFLKCNVEKNENDILYIRNQTVDQAYSKLWKSERHLRLTSSNFGKVMRRRPTNVSNALVKNILYSNFKGNIHTIRGLAQESNTIIEYKNMNSNVDVEKTGLQICKTHNFLGASTDGIVTNKTTNEKGLLEIKNYLQTNTYTIREATKKVNNFCLEIENNNLQLKRNHEIYYQIQGQLNIFDLEWCDFILRRNNPYDIFIERIYKDSHLWKLEMLPKLTSFYSKFLLPELTLPRYGTYTGIREPKSPWFQNKPVRSVLKEKCKNRRKGNKNEGLDIVFEEIVKPGPSTAQKDCTSTEQCPHENKSALSGPSQIPTDDTSSKKYPQKNKSALSGPSQTPTDDTCSKKYPQKVLSTAKRSHRSKVVKFVGREISHKWVIDEKKKKTKWFNGTVLDVIKGKDGEDTAVYEVLYRGEETPYEVNGLSADFAAGSLKFVDI